MLATIGLRLINMEEDGEDNDDLVYSESLTRMQEILDMVDNDTETIVMLHKRYKQGSFEIVSTAHSAEEAYMMMLEGIEGAREDVKEENILSLPVDKLFN